MALQNCTENRLVKSTGFQKLNQAEFVFGASQAQCDDGKVFGGKDAHRHTINVSFNALIKGFPEKRMIDWKKLDGPTGNDGISFCVEPISLRLQISVDWIERNERLTREGI